MIGGADRTARGDTAREKQYCISGSITGAILCAGGAAASGETGCATESIEACDLVGIQRFLYIVPYILLPDLLRTVVPALRRSALRPKAWFIPAQQRPGFTGPKPR